MSTGGPSPDRVLTVHRIGAFVVAGTIAIFGILGFVGGLAFFDTDGDQVLGLSTNGLLSLISLVTAAVLIAAAVRGGKLASTVMIVVGVLFLVSGLGNMALLNTEINYLAFELPNVFFSLAAGMVLLFVGTYGRFTGGLPEDNPYRRERSPKVLPDEGDWWQPLPRDADEQQADREMADAERAAAQHVATPEQQRRLEEADAQPTQEERRRVWMDSAESESTADER